MSHQRVAVFGIGKTGQASAAVLKQQGAHVTVFDDTPETKTAVQQSAGALRILGCEVYSGEYSFNPFEFDFAVVSPGLPRNHHALQKANVAGLTVISEIELAYRLAKAPIIAVTGSNGKSTTTALMHNIFINAGLKSWLCGNIAGIEHEITLVEAAFRALSDDILAAEVSSAQLERIVDFKPKAAVLTVIQPDHLDRYDNNFQLYADTKAKIFSNQTASEFAILNFDDPISSQYAKTINSSTIGATLKEHIADNDTIKAYIKDDILTVNMNGAPIDLIHLNDLKLPGSFNQMNALLASAAALALGISPTPIRDTLKEFSGLPHRMEVVEIQNGVRYINNSMCTNPHAAAASIASLKQPTIVIAGGVNKNLDFTPLADIAKEHIKYLILIGRDADQLAAPLTAKGFTGFEYAETLESAVARANSIAVSGDTVMLAPGCASFDMFVDFRDRGNQFKKLVRGFTAGE